MIAQLKSLLSDLIAVIHNRICRSDCRRVVDRLLVLDVLIVSERCDNPSAWGCSMGYCPEHCNEFCSDCDDDDDGGGEEIDLPHVPTPEPKPITVNTRWN